MSVGIQDALAKLYLKLGGDPEKIKENKNVTDYLDDLADVFKSLIELPVVSSTDNGKVLKVISGKWGKGEITKELPTVSNTDNGKILAVSNGVWSKSDIPSNIVIFEGTISSSNFQLSNNKKISDIKTALSDGKTVILKGDINHRYPLYYLSNYYPDNDDIRFSRSCLEYSSNSLIIETIFCIGSPTSKNLAYQTKTVS